MLTPRSPLQILGDKAGFEQAVRETIQHVSFDQPVRIQTFEVTIRALGGLVRRLSPSFVTPSLIDCSAALWTPPRQQSETWLRPPMVQRRATLPRP